jgi:hypothetical protein
MGQVEVMAPLFSRDALKTCLVSFNENKSSWGLDCVWSKLLNYPVNKLAVIDAITMKHIHPVGVGELYTKLDIDPKKEWELVTRKYEASKNRYFECGRYLIVDNKNNRMIRACNKISQAFLRLKQSYLDLGLAYRLQNKLKIKAWTKRS